MHELYAADAGIEDAIWSLIYDYPISVSAPPYTWDYSLSDVVNRPPVESVSIMIEYLPSDGVHKITSTATSYDGSTIVEAHVTGIVHIYYGDLLVYPGDTIPGDVYVDGRVELENEAKILGNVSATEDVILNAYSQIGGTICTDGDLELNAVGIVVEGDVYAVGNVLLSADAQVYGDVHAGGDVVLNNQSIIGGELYSGGHVQLSGPTTRIYGDVHLIDVDKNPTGPGIYGDDDPNDGCNQKCPDYETAPCPLGLEGSADIQSWEIKSWEIE